MKNVGVPKEALKDGRRLGGKSRGIWSNAAERDAKRILKCRKCRRSAEDIGGGLKTSRLQGWAAVPEKENRKVLCEFCEDFMFIGPCIILIVE